MLVLPIRSIILIRLWFIRIVFHGKIVTAYLAFRISKFILHLDRNTKYKFNDHITFSVNRKCGICTTYYIIELYREQMPFKKYSYFHYITFMFTISPRVSQYEQFRSSDGAFVRYTFGSSPETNTYAIIINLSKCAVRRFSNIKMHTVFVLQE